MVSLKVPSRDLKRVSKYRASLRALWGFSLWSAPNFGTLFRVHFVRVLYSFGDLTRDPKLKNYPKRTLRKRQKHQFKGFSVHNLKNCI